MSPYKSTKQYKIKRLTKLFLHADNTMQYSLVRVNSGVLGQSAAAGHDAADKLNVRRRGTSLKRAVVVVVLHDACMVWFGMK